MIDVGCELWDDGREGLIGESRGAVCGSSPKILGKLSPTPYVSLQKIVQAIHQIALKSCDIVPLIATILALQSFNKFSKLYCTVYLLFNEPIRVLYYFYKITLTKERNSAPACENFPGLSFPKFCESIFLTDSLVGPDFKLPDIFHYN